VNISIDSLKNHKLILWDCIEQKNSLGKNLSNKFLGHYYINSLMFLTKDLLGKAEMFRISNQVCTYDINYGIEKENYKYS
jgi:hypothetical protein